MVLKNGVSVLCITYNHEKSIGTAIEGFLSQKINVPYEIIIGEDCSTDNTASIIKVYHKKHPEIIKPIYRKKNIGYMNNFVDTFNNCNGEYIALCEGDDYWIDDRKLKKQIDFLERNKDFSLCSHAVKTVFENVIAKDPFVTPLKISSFQDILDHGHFIPTLSIVFKRSALERLPQWFNELWVSDIPLIMLLTLNGKNYYFNDIMGVKRRHPGGITQDPNRIGNIAFTEEILESRVFFYKKLLKKTNAIQRKVLKRHLSEKIFQLSLIKIKKWKFPYFFLFLFESIYYNPKIIIKKIKGN